MAVGILLAAVVSGCVAPALDSGAFQHNAIAALESAVSATRVAATALDARAAERLPLAYADTVVTEAEEALGPIQSSFGTVDPPDRRLDALRSEVAGQLGDAADLLAEARIAVRRQDTSAMRQVARDLRKIADEMERGAEALP